MGEQLPHEEANDFAIDRVVIIQVEGGERSVTVDVFLRLPLQERIAIILADNARYYHGEALIEPSRAMRWLRHKGRSPR